MSGLHSNPFGIWSGDTSRADQSTMAMFDRVFGRRRAEGIAATIPTNKLYYGTCAGTNTYTTTATPTPGSYATGDIYILTFTNGNTGAITINANSLGAKAGQYRQTAFIGFEILSASTSAWEYDGTQFQYIGIIPGRPPYPDSLINPAGLIIPLAAQFTTLINSPTFTDKSDRLQLAINQSAANLSGGTLNSISAPYTLDAQVISGITAGTSTNGWFGIGLSDGTKFRMFGVGASTAAHLFISTWTNSTTFSAYTVQDAGALAGAAGFLRITDDNAGTLTSRKFYWSPNGKDYNLLLSESPTGVLTPTKFVFAGFNNSTAATVVKAAISHWLVTASVLGDAP